MVAALQLLPPMKDVLTPKGQFLLEASILNVCDKNTLESFWKQNLSIMREDFINLTNEFVSIIRSRLS